MIQETISVVVPVYNASKTLEKIIDKLVDVLSRFKDYEIILVDDCSIDNSFQCLKKLKKQYSKLKVLKLKENSGQQCAILCGLSYSTKDVICIIDDDLDQNPSDILRLYESLSQGFDVVYGITDYKTVKSFGSIMRDLLFNTITNIPKGIKVSAFRIMKNEIKEKIIQADTSFVYISMEILKYTQNIGNIRVETNKVSESNYTFTKLLNLYKNIIFTYALHLNRSSGKSCYEVENII